MKVLPRWWSADCDSSGWGKLAVPYLNLLFFAVLILKPLPLLLAVYSSTVTLAVMALFEGLGKSCVKPFLLYTLLIPSCYICGWMMLLQVGLGLTIPFVCALSTTVRWASG